MILMYSTSSCQPKGEQTCLIFMYNTNLLTLTQSETTCVIIVFITNSNMFITINKRRAHFPQDFHHCCHQHHKQFRMFLRTKKSAPQTCSCWPRCSGTVWFCTMTNGTLPSDDGAQRFGFTEFAFRPRSWIPNRDMVKTRQEMHQLSRAVAALRHFAHQMRHRQSPNGVSQGNNNGFL